MSAPNDSSRSQGWLFEAKALLLLGWPLVLMNLAQMAIGTTDIIMLGWVGPQALAAATLGGNLYLAVLIFGIGLVMAASPILAQTIGRKRQIVRRSRQVVRQAAWIALGYSGLAWLALWQGGNLLRWMGQDAALADSAEAYLRIFQFGMLPALWFVVLRSFVSAFERPKAALVATVVAIGFNALANYGLIFGNFGLPALGIVGAGYASVLANLFQFVLLLGFVLWDRQFRRFYLLGRLWRGDRKILAEMLRVGLPIGAILGFEVTIFNAAALLMGLVGPHELAAHAIAIQVSGISFMVPMGIAQAATIRVGLAVGRGDAVAAGKAGWSALAIGVGFMTVMAVTFITTPLPIIDIFLDIGEPANLAVVQHAVSFLAVAGMFQIVDGAQTVGAGALRGLKDTKVPMIFAGIGYWLIGLPLGAYLAFYTAVGGVGIWIGLAMGLASVALLMVGRWSRVRKRGLAVQQSPATAAA